MVQKEWLSKIRDNPTDSQETNSTGSYESLASLDFGDSSTSFVEEECVPLDMVCPLSGLTDEQTGDYASDVEGGAELANHASDDEVDLFTPQLGSLSKSLCYRGPSDLSLPQRH